jgi:hypothetical protein
MYFLQVKCTSCHETHPKVVSLNRIVRALSVEINRALQLAQLGGTHRQLEQGSHCSLRLEVRVLQAREFRKV